MIGVLGGTFDPVHHGHLRLAVEAGEGLGLDPVLLIPAGLPPHRAAPVAGAADRVGMLRAAIEGCPRLRVDTREVERPGPSYTVDTLHSLRQEHPRTPLCLLLGMDAFAGLDTWHRWQELMDLAHLVVIRRPGGGLPEAGPVADLLARREVSRPGDLRESPAGSILLRDAPLLEISATRLRRLIAAARDPAYLTPAGVLHIIQQRGLYIARA